MKQPLGHRLRRARVKAGLSRDGATDRANRLLPPNHQFVPVTLTRIENGTIARTDVAILAALARVYRMSLKELDIDVRDEAVLLTDLFIAACAPSDSNREPAGSESAILRAG